MTKHILTLEVENTKNRDGYIDILRGTAMILVLLHHAGFRWGKYILGFHMPFFFILSGYLYSVRDSFDKRPWGGVLVNTI